MEHFLRSGQSVDYSLAVSDSHDKKNSIIADILTEGQAGKIDASVSLAIQNKKGPSAFDLTGSDLFAIMSPAYDVTLRDRRQRDVIYISAPSGAGKSTWTGQYARAWQRHNDEHGRKQRVIVFSAVQEDPAFDGVELKRVPFDSLVDDDGEPNDAIEIDNLRDSLVIFDDIDVIANKKLRHWIQELRNRCLEIGRHKNINLIATTHQLMNYKETKIMLMECTKVVFFPNSGSAAQIKRYLKTYADLSPEEIKRVFSLKSRWVMLNKSSPRYILHATGGYLL